MQLVGPIAPKEAMMSRTDRHAVQFKHFYVSNSQLSNIAQLNARSIVLNTGSKFWIIFFPVNHISVHPKKRRFILRPKENSESSKDMFSRRLHFKIDGFFKQNGSNFTRVMQLL